MIAIIAAFWFVVVASSFSIYAVYAQTNSNNMSSSMIESARMHIRAADKALASSNATGALDQVNFAQMQLSMIGMKNMGTMNEQQVKEFMKGGGSGNSSTHQHRTWTHYHRIVYLVMMECCNVVSPDNKKGVNKKLPVIFSYSRCHLYH